METHAIINGKFIVWFTDQSIDLESITKEKV